MLIKIHKYSIIYLRAQNVRYNILVSTAKYYIKMSLTAHFLFLNKFHGILIMRK